MCFEQVHSLKCRRDKKDEAVTVQKGFLIWKDDLLLDLVTNTDPSPENKLHGTNFFILNRMFKTGQATSLYGLFLTTDSNASMGQQGNRHTAIMLILKRG